MNEEGITVEQRIGEYEQDLRKALDHLSQARQLLADGDVKGACQTLSLSDYPLSHARDDLASILEAFAGRGVTPD